MSESEHEAQLRAARLAAALSDPLRLGILAALLSGPAAVTELCAATGASQPNVSNHLALLRAERLVRSERVGRQVHYELRDWRIAELLEALLTVAGATPQLPRAAAPMAEARTCYDHLAGRLGVALFDRLVETGALIPPEVAGAEATLGAQADDVFGCLGVDLAGARRAKRRFAPVCLDWTERRFHVGGALGAALWRRSTEVGWIERADGRAVRLTEAGRAALAEQLGLNLPVGVTAS